MRDEPTIVLVHGAWHGPWVWDRVVEVLADRGRASVVVELASAGTDPDLLGGLADDAAAVAAALDDLDAPAVLVGHSYGGQVISEASAGRGDVVHLVYVSAFVLDVGQAMTDVIGHDPLPWSHVVADGVATRISDVRDVLYGDLDADEAGRSEARLVAQSTASFIDRLTGAGWHEIPSTYVLTEHDRALPRWMQQPMAARVDTVRPIATSHSPFLSAPDDLVDLLVTLA